MVGGCRLVTFIDGCVRPGLRCSATTPQVRISGLSAALLFKALEKALHEHICDQTGAPSSQRDGRNSGIAGAANAAAGRAADGLPGWAAQRSVVGSERATRSERARYPMRPVGSARLGSARLGSALRLASVAAYACCQQGCEPITSLVAMGGQRFDWMLRLMRWLQSSAGAWASCSTRTGSHTPRNRAR
jgi:hypothetical protein